jgi:hypothetical protein
MNVAGFRDRYAAMSNDFLLVYLALWLFIRFHAVR